MTVATMTVAIIIIILVIDLDIAHGHLPAVLVVHVPSQHAGRSYKETAGVMSADRTITSSLLLNSSVDLLWLLS